MHIIKLLAIALLGSVNLVVAAPAAAALAEATPRYDIRAEVSPAERILTVDAQVLLPPLAVARGSLAFRLRDDMGMPEVELAGVSAGLGPVALRRELLADTQTDVQWTITPATAFPADRPIALRIRHSGGATVSLNFYVGPEIVFVGGGTTAWHAQFDGGRGTGSLRLAMPSGFSALATGARGDDTVNGAVREVTFTASRPTSLGFAAGHYQVRHVEGARPISLYLLSDRDFADELIDVARQSIDVLSDEFGPFPFESFAIAEVPTGPAMQSGFLGAAYDGYMLMRTDYLDSEGADPGFFGHEIGHQWWGVSVQQAGEAGEYMLDEALAQYAALKVVERLEGLDAARRFRAGEGRLPGAEDALALIAAGYDSPLSALPTGPGFYELSDTKGYLAYDAIDRALGGGRLRALLRDIAARHASSELAWSAFRSALESAAGRDGAAAVAQWLDRTGLPILSHRWSASEGGIVLTIEQEAPAYRLKLPVRLTFADGATEMRAIAIAELRTDVAMAIPQPVRAVEIDPERTVPHATPAERADAIASAHATRARLLWDSGQTVEAERELRAGLATRGIPQANPAEFLERFYLGWIIEEAGDLDGAIAQYEAALRLPTRVEERMPRLYLNLARASYAKGDAARGAWAARAVIALEDAAGERTFLSRRAETYLAGN